MDDQQSMGQLPCNPAAPTPPRPACAVSVLSSYFLSSTSTHSASTTSSFGLLSPPAPGCGPEAFAVCAPAPGCCDDLYIASASLWLACVNLSVAALSLSGSPSAIAFF